MFTSKSSILQQRHNVLLSVVLLFMLTAVFFTSCQTNHDTMGEVHHTEVIRPNIQEYGPYVYVDGRTIMRYNRGTNLLSSACVDPECEGACPIEAAISSVNQVVDGRMFFCAFEAYTHVVRYGYQDVVSGDIRILATLSEAEDSMNSGCYVWDGWMYYSKRILQEGGDPDLLSDYIPHVCRVSVEKGNEESVMPTDESLMMVADGYIITQKDGILYAYNAVTLEKKTLYNLEENGFSTLATTLSYAKGRIYFLCRSHSICTSEYSKREFLYPFLISIDLETGEASRVVENPVITFAVTDDAIYYAPFELRHMYIPENYIDVPEEVVVFLADDTLYACDLDGSRNREVYTNDGLDFVECFTVIDGVLYGWLYDFDDESHRFTTGYFGSIDFQTGKVTRAEKE